MTTRYYEKDKDKSKEMTEKEIFKKLDLIRSDIEKIKYLESVLKRKKLLSPKTQERVYNTLLDLYIKNERWDAAEELAEKLGMRIDVEELAEKLRKKYQERIKRGY